MIRALIKGVGSLTAKEAGKEAALALVAFGVTLAAGYAWNRYQQSRKDARNG